MLPPPRSLRTGLATFTASGSSLSNAHGGGRSTVTYDCYHACPVRLCNMTHVTEVTQARASRRSGFMFSTNSCSLHHYQRVPGRKTTRKSAPLPAAVMSPTARLMQRLSRSLPAGIRLLRDPLPASQRLPLRSAFRHCETRVATGKAGLTTFRVKHGSVEVAS